MDADAKKTTLRMIPYGLYVLTAEGAGGVAAATVNWVTQVAFQPPLLVVGVKADSGAHALVKQERRFALNVLGKGQGDLAYKFFKPATREGDTIGGEKVTRGANGAPLLDAAIASVECALVETVEKGDHSVFVAEVTDVKLNKAPTGRPDAAILELKDLGEKVFYGG